MKYDSYSLGYDLKFEGPATVEEYDTKAGKTGMCLSDAVDNTIYRGTLPDFQEAFAKKLAETYGITRGTDEKATEAKKAKAKADAKVEPVAEKVKAFNLRVRATVLANLTGDDLKAKEAELSALAQSVADTITVDPSPSKRASSAVNKGDLQKAQDILNHDDAYITAAVEKMSAKVPTFELEMDAETSKPDEKSLAKLVGLYVDARLAEDLA